jgi:hypothetical protein
MAFASFYASRFTLALSLLASPPLFQEVASLFAFCILNPALPHHFGDAMDVFFGFLISAWAAL